MHPSATPSSPPWLIELGWSDRYEILDLVGSGGMGQVWRAREIATNRIVALKVLSPHHTGDEHLLARLDVEAATLIKLRDAGQHEHIVPIIDFKLGITHACLVMEFIPGLNLCKWCDTQRLDLNARVRLIAQVAHATGWFHSLEVVHRDLKPANILVSAITHQPVIVDFSIAKVHDTLPLTLTNEALGTAPYMAPEQLNCVQTEITPATDVFALGVNLYELTTRVLPHPGELPLVIQRHQNEVRPVRPSLLNKEIPRDLESICLKALSHRPKDRYENGEQFAADLDRYIEGNPVVARPMSPLGYLARQARRRSALTASLVTILLLTLIYSWTAWRNSRERTLNELQQEVAFAMQGKTWSRDLLQRMDLSLLQIAALNPNKALTLREALLDDVVSDAENTLRLPSLTDNDVLSIRESAAWMRLQNKDQAQRLSNLLTERLGRWQSVFEQNAPFDRDPGLFLNREMRTLGGLLYPDYGAKQEATYQEHIVLKQEFATPAEISATFVPDGPNFTQMAFGVMFQETRSEARIYKVRYAPTELLGTLPEKQLDPDGAILCIESSKRFQRSLYIPDIQVLTQPLRITFSIESRQIRAELNGKWSLSWEDSFVATATSRGNRCRIAWPNHLGLSQITIRRRLIDEANPLESGDVFYAQTRWLEAQRAYDSLIGDPTYGAEALYKSALTHWHRGDLAPALDTWEKLSSGPPSPWRDLSTYRLWYEKAKAEGARAAHVYLERFPPVESLSPSVRNSVSPEERAMLSSVYARVGKSLNGIRRNLEGVSDAAKAFRIIGIAPIETAANLALAQHFNGLDSAARSLLANALEKTERALHDQTEQKSAFFAIDHWTRMARSENDSGLAHVLNLWRAAYPNHPDIQAVCDQEEALVRARAEDFVAALEVIERVQKRPDVDQRLVTNSWLIKGLIEHLQGHENQALESWKRGLSSSATVKHRSSLHLCDLIVLHSAARTWSREACVQVITQLLGKGDSGSPGLSLQSAFISTFLANSEFVQSLNTIADDTRGQELIRSYALRTLTARDLVRQWYGLIMERYHLSSAFASQPSPGDQARVHETVEHILDALGNNDGDQKDFFTYAEAWSSPWLSKQFLNSNFPFPAPLVARLKWLLAQRYLHTGHPDEARGLLTKIMDEGSFDSEWREAIHAQLK